MQLICGINPVLEALSAGTRHFDRLVIVKGLRNRRVSEAISRASQLGISLRFESRETLDRMAGGLPHQGIVAVVSAKPAMALEDLLVDARTPPLLVVLDGVEDPRNLGAILRTSEGAGADGVLLPERHSAGLSETVARASAGGLEHVRVARIGNVVQALETLKAKGFWIVGFDGNATERWDAVDYRRPIALVLGGEGRGIRRLVREHCDHLVSIPLFGHVASLNVSVAAGIALYEAIRQRGSIPSHVRPIPPRAAAAGSIVAPGPDDDVHDPGHVERPSYAGSDEEAEEDPVSLVQIEDEEQYTAPEVVHVRTHSRDTRGDRRHGGRGRFDRRHRPKPAAPNARPAPPQQPQAPAESAAGAPAPQNREGRGRKRRRRRGKGRDGAPGAGPASSGHAPPSSHGAQAPPTSNGETPSGGRPVDDSAGAAQGDKRRRRRRRRR